MAAGAKDGLEYLDVPYSGDTALSALSLPLRRWFVQHFNKPTSAQRFAWPSLSAGKNLLLCAPTGAGKTLAAFLPIIDRLLPEGPGESVRCLYLAPLKALGNDALKNLHSHLQGIAAFLPQGAWLPRVALRTGDTSARRRRDLFSQPPDILLTTPESLAVLLSQEGAAALFARLRPVVVDEVHALAPNKRGADLALSLERLEQRTGVAFQRIGLSATCNPLDEAARFLVGVGRPCAVATVADQAPLQINIEPLADHAVGGFPAALMNRLGPELAAGRTTLIFANTRALTERLGWALRRRYPQWDGRIAIHHSSLALARRREVEAGLKQGAWKVVVTSTSLELGIDIGAVDTVILVHPPREVIRLLQRVGRSGHGPGQPRRGLVLTETPAALLEAAVTGASGRAAQYERSHVQVHPLDILCQHLLGMAAAGVWTAEEAYGLVRRAYPYRDLVREDFDDCLAYLSGKRRDGRDWLPARIRWEGETFRVLDERTARLLRRNLGSIVSDEPKRVRLREPNPGDHNRRIIGHVDEPFADRLQAGDRFLLDGSCVEFRRNEGRDVVVDEVAGQPGTPQWGSAGWPLSSDLARRLYAMRSQAAQALLDGPPALADMLRRDYVLSESAVAIIVEYFQRQECVSEIPQRTTCLIEVVATECGIDHYFHTPLNRNGNDALARIVALRIGRQSGLASRSIVADLGFAVSVDSPHRCSAGKWRDLLTAKGFHVDLDLALADSTILRERFQQVAQTGLMLLRNPLGGRRRVGGRWWGERRLFEIVRSGQPDFVLLRQALHEVQEEACDASAALAFLLELSGQPIHYRVLTQPSPFAQNWSQVQEGPGEPIDTPAEALEKLHAALTVNGVG